MRGTAGLSLRAGEAETPLRTTRPAARLLMLPGRKGLPNRGTALQRGSTFDPCRFHHPPHTKETTMGTLELGCIAREKITGFEGTIVAKTTQLSNCPRYTLQPTHVKDGVPISCRSSDEMSLEWVSASEHVVWPAARPKEQVQLGDEVECTLTGLRGVAFAMTIWSNGCSRISVQPRELKDGAPVEPSVLDEKDLRRVKAAKPAPKVAKTGGPRAEPRRR